ncbi:hypothetical protein HHK36_024334 [Tetracentron sinense]|uniref:Lsm14-like N-terminal domain-containing protein n=1 Tax=Tetracentron sinense TaxID=13715 RepID=A0A834YKT3_TETSI|nr:hypothetical protein HHK36_024334 [Tetracentron sinense]
MATEASRSSGSADSYIGSLISLTSKCEIRYEGVLYNINTEESSIGLRNVRSFGTEGRKKDGPQVPPIDKVYEYILSTLLLCGGRQDGFLFFALYLKQCSSSLQVAYEDPKTFLLCIWLQDLQVKSSPPVQATPPIHNDPAIIQSHYPPTASASTSLPSAVVGSVTDLSSHTAQLGLPRSTFQGGLPLYQPGGSLGSWGSSPPPPSANGMPMYWQGFYGPSSGLSHVQQQSLLRPPPGLSMLPSMQLPMQYPGMNASLPTGAANSLNLPEFPPPLLQPVSTGSLNLTSTTLPPSTLPTTLPPVQSSAQASEISPSLMPKKAPTPVLPTATLSGSLPLVSPLTTTSPATNAIVPPISNKPKTVLTPSFPYQTMSQSVSSTVGASSSSHTETSTPSLVTPGQLLRPGATTLSSSSQPSQTVHKDVKVVASSSVPPPQAPTEAQAPILPLPSPSNQKISHPLTTFTEDFDFMAMNEKFKKEEVWGHLGRSKEDEREGDEDDSQDEDDAALSNYEAKPVYVKDDFFDSISCNALDRGSQNGRTRFSEQMKIDTEVMCPFSLSITLQDLGPTKFPLDGCRLLAIFQGIEVVEVDVGQAVGVVHEVLIMVGGMAMSGGAADRQF